MGVNFENAPASATLSSPILVEACSNPMSTDEPASLQTEAVPSELDIVPLAALEPSTALVDASFEIAPASATQSSPNEMSPRPRDRQLGRKLESLLFKLGSLTLNPVLATCRFKKGFQLRQTAFDSPRTWTQLIYLFQLCTQTLCPLRDLLSDSPLAPAPAPLALLHHLASPQQR